MGFTACSSDDGPESDDTTTVPIASAGSTPESSVPEPAPDAVTVALSDASPATEFEVVSHVDVGGFSSNVWVHGDYAHLGSFGQDAAALPPGAPGAGGDVDLCPTSGVRVFDLADPVEPALVGTYADGISEPDIDGTWNETVVVQTVTTASFDGVLSLVPFFRCASDGFQGFGLYDVTDASAPKRLSTVEMPNPRYGNQEPFLDVRDGHAYVYTANASAELLTGPDAATPGDPDFVVYDVTDPTSPQRVAEWGAWQQLGIHPQGPDENGINRNRFVHTVYARDGIAYLSYFDNGTVMLDVSDPTKPAFLGQTSFDANESGNAEHATIGGNGSLLIETAEHFPQESEFMPDLAGPSEYAWGYVRTYDVTDPSAPVRLGTLETENTRVDPPPPGAVFYTPNFVRTQGDIAYFAWTGEGVVVADMSDPTHPTQVAQFKTPATPDPFGFFFGGLPITYVWGVDFHGDDIIVSDANSGLWVLRLRQTADATTGQSPSAAASQSEPLTITATDTSFEMPAFIDAGAHTITLENEGLTDHHAEIYQLGDGHDFADFFAASSNGPDAINEVATPISGPATTPPGASATISLALNSGRYVIIDVLPSATGAPNFLNGMMREFIVRGNESGVPDPAAEPEITMGEFTFGLPDIITNGPTTYGFRNAGLQQHEMTVVRLEDGATLADSLNYFDELIPPPAPTDGTPPPAPTPPSQTPPFTYAGGLMAMAAQRSGSVVLDLEPGTYALICSLIDPDTGTPHYRLGMAEELTVE